MSLWKVLIIFHNDVSLNNSHLRSLFSPNLFPIEFSIGESFDGVWRAMASSSAAVPLPVGLVKRDFAEDSAKDFAKDCDPAAGLPNKDQAVKWPCTTPGCPFLSHKMWMSLKAFAANAALNTFGSKRERRGMPASAGKIFRGQVRSARDLNTAGTQRDQSTLGTL